MTTISDDMQTQIKALPDTEKLKLVDTTLKYLDRPDPELDRIWANEARQRWASYKQGEQKPLTYEEVMKKYRRP